MARERARARARAKARALQGRRRRQGGCSGTGQDHGRACAQPSGSTAFHPSRPAGRHRHIHPKTAKYSFADKLSEKGSERATAYMESIWCYLDLRAKGQRNPENKFMTGAIVDGYVMGRLRDPKSKSPGLAASTLAMCEFAYGSSKQAKAMERNGVAQPSAAAPAVPAQQSCGTRRRRAGPSIGFAAGAASDNVVAADGSGEPES
eukprot:5294182-Pleurochrysis_carterae.AAC.1